MSAIDEDYVKLRKQIEGALQAAPTSGTPQSREYQGFRKQYQARSMNAYEQFCAFAQKLNIKPNKTDYARYQKAIDQCHLNATPEGAFGLSLLAPMFLLFLGVLFGVVIPMALDPEAGPSLFFFVLFVLIAAIMYLPLKNLPFTLADNWRARASNQMVLALFYITTYMRHTSNLERAIDFAADHVGPPLALDLKKVVWNVQTEKYASLQDSLDAYMIQWKDTNLEFVESMNLVQASLYETSNERRLNSLQKAMDLMLEETYEKMLHYAQNLKSPMTMLHMLGIILPILGLVILPLAVSFLDGLVKWYHIAVLYNLLLPLGVFLLGKSILVKRPSSYGNTDLTEINPDLRKYRSRLVIRGGKTFEINPLNESVVLGIGLVLFALSPLIIHFVAPEFDMVLFGPHTLLGYTLDIKTGTSVGPFGLGAAILSLCFTMGAGFALAHYYSVRSKRLMRIREDTKALEQEFAGAMFQLGNRLGDGLPAEIAFGKVAEVMQGTKSGEFFSVVSINIQKMGMSVEQAIFDSKRGAILLYPSPIIESSMKVLVESSRKGPAEASQSLITMSTYIKEMHRVEERLKDLMADIISGMKSQITFLTPAIAGIVVGITSMITTILGQLHTKVTELGASGGLTDGGNLSDLGGLGLGIPTYFFQAVVGLYVVQIIWLLAYLVNGIENGQDSLNEEYEQAKGLQRGVGLYVVISLIVMLLFNVIAGTVLSSALTN